MLYKLVAMVTAVASDLWIAESKIALPKGMLPFAIPAWVGRCSVRMTIVKLSSGGLLLHSPIPYTKELGSEVDKLGPVSFIVGPSVMHHLFVREWSYAYPKAKPQIAPKTHKRNRTLSGVDELAEGDPIAPQDLEQILMQGHRNYESFFLHRKTGTLLVTDLAYGLLPGADFAERAWFYANGVRNPLGMTGYQRRNMKDFGMFKRTLERVLAWDFDRIVMAHGAILEKEGKPHLARIWK